MTSDSREEFGRFYRATYAGLVAELFALTADFAAAQDLAQEAYVRAWTKWRTIGAYDDPRGWLHLVARRLAVSKWRKATAAVRTLVRHGPPPNVAEPSPDSVALVAALQRLPEAQRRALVLHHMAGRTVAEIATAEHVAEGTVKARLSRGRAALAGFLTETTPEATEHA